MILLYPSVSLCYVLSPAPPHRPSAGSGCPRPKHRPRTQLWGRGTVATSPTGSHLPGAPGAGSARPHSPGTARLRPGGHTREERWWDESQTQRGPEAPLLVRSQRRNRDSLVKYRWKSRPGTGRASSYSRCIPGMAPSYSRSIPLMVLRYSRSIPGMALSYSRSIPAMVPRYSRSIPGMAPRYSRSIPGADPANPAPTQTRPASSPALSSAALLPLLPAPVFGHLPSVPQLVPARRCLTKGLHFQHSPQNCSARLSCVPSLAPPAPRADANPEEPPTPQPGEWRPAAPAGTGAPQEVPVSCHRSQEPTPLWWDVILQDGGLMDHASHKGLAAPNPEGGRPSLVCRVPAPAASLQPRCKWGVPISSALQGGYPKSLGRIVGAAEASEAQSSWFTLHPCEGREGEKCRDPARWALQKRDGCRRRGLSLVIVIAGELDQQAIFSHLSRKIQVRANS
ncbi:PREDICTED: leucine-rich repeat extensin-like protein 5 [Ficedula albicollis]|uniref:leucine-rich repeat extensin-like protein 5 n=1 Tax=Ficedula albicollis TaxID=59894 RepID=UPI00035A1649|nr:PREDICTED: leucine-rich repeat extensin-like protein 5 [Ficedula albicollis]